MNCDIVSGPASALIVSPSISDSMKWHARLGHPGRPATDMLVKANLLKYQHAKHDFCNDCAIGKSKRLPYRTTSTIYSKPGDLVNSDIKFFPVPTFDDEIGSITYLDRATHYSVVYLLKSKSGSDILDTFDAYSAMFLNQFGYQMKAFRTDNGREYINKQFQSRLSSLGISFQSTVPYSPQQNGAAERLNRTLEERLMTMKSAGNIPNKFWGELWKTANYFQNRSPSVYLNGSTPYHKWFGKDSSIDHLRVIGCDVFAHVPTEIRKGLADKALPCKMLGYAVSQKAYRLWDIKNQVMIVARNCVFNEDSPNLPYHFQYGNRLSADEIPLTFPTYDDSIPVDTFEVIPFTAPDHSAETIVLPAVNSNTISDSSDEDSFITDEHSDSDSILSNPPSPLIGVAVPDPIIRTRRSRTTIPNYKESDTDDYLSAEESNFMTVSKIFDDPQAMTISLASPSNTDRFIPRNFSEAQNSAHAHEWMLASVEEMTSLQLNDVYELVQRPLKKKIVGTKWHYTIKEKANGEIDRYKARFVVKGYSQIEGIDYVETFSPVIKSKSVKILLSLANVEGWEVHQMDVKTAFLNSELEEDIYVKQPDGFQNKKFPDYVWKLKKALYGLKQSPRQWWITMRDFLFSLGFVACNFDPCIFLLDRDGVLTYLGLYVDDLQICGGNASFVSTIKENLCERFQMKDLGLVSYLLGLEIKMNSRQKRLTICQEKYVKDLLVQFDLDHLRPLSIPMDPSCKLSKSSCPDPGSSEFKEMTHRPYRELVGALMYLACATRPDISHAVGEVARFVSNPGMDHWQAVVKICRYLSGTKDYGLHFDGNIKDASQVYGFSDADWGNDVDTRRSKTGYAIFMNGGCVSWRSKLQTCVSQSTLEAEYVAANETGRELVWARGIADELGYKQRSSTLFEDNQPCIATAKNPVINDRVKHIDIKYHWIRDEVAAGSLTLTYCPTADMTADILTKALPRVPFSRLCKKLGLYSVRSLSGWLLN